MKKRGVFSIGSFALILVVTVVAAAFFTWKTNSNEPIKAPEDLEDYLFWQAKQLNDFTLIGANRQTLNLDSLKDKWSFVFFGYIQCPDVCPMTLGVLASAFADLKQNPDIYEEIQGIFVSVDPQRDTLELLKEYASYFGSEFSGFTGSTEQIDAFTRQMGALYAIHDEEPGEDPDAYVVTHNSAVFLVDPRGRLYGRFPPPHDAQNIADTFIKLRAFYKEQDDKRWGFF
ncbi:MAG: SCO family protein [Gammaproteobacteria bacterium]|nr:SCO family protein [Gammaproteobacteria bacterium]